MSVREGQPVVFLSMAGCGIEFLQRGFEQSPVLRTAADFRNGGQEDFAELDSPGQQSALFENYGLSWNQQTSSFETQALGDAVFNWLSQQQCPVVHCVRSNALDCLASLMTSCEVPSIPSEDAVGLIEDLKKQVDRVRSQLRDANFLELRLEQLVSSDGKVIPRTISQICSFTGIEFSSLNLEHFAPPETTNTRYDIAKIKRALRPDLTRRGWENLFELPKAA